MVNKSHRESIGISLVLIGTLVLVLMFVFSNDGSRVTGFFSAAEKNTGQFLASDNNYLSDNITNLSGNIESNDSQGSLNSGLFILDNPRDKLIAYGIFIGIIVLGVILISLGSWKKKNQDDMNFKRKKR